MSSVQVNVWKGAKGIKLTVLYGGRSGVSLLPLPITETSSNCGRPRAHARRGGWVALSSECVTLSRNDQHDQQIEKMSR